MYIDSDNRKDKYGEKMTWGYSKLESYHQNNKTKYTMDPGIYFLMKTNKQDIIIKVPKIA